MADGTPSPGRAGPFLRSWGRSGRMSRSTSYDASTRSPGSSVSLESPFSATTLQSSSPTRSPVPASPFNVTNSVISTPSEADISDASGSRVNRGYFGPSKLRLSASAAGYAATPQQARAGSIWKMLSPPGNRTRKKKKAQGKQSRKPSAVELEDRSEYRMETLPSTRRESRCKDSSHGSEWTDYTLDTMERSSSRPILPRGRSFKGAKRHKKGFYNRSKRFVKRLRGSGGSGSEQNQSDSGSSKSRTREVLDIAASALQTTIDRTIKSQSNPTLSLTSSPSGESVSSRRIQMLVHRSGTAMSKSSSILSFLMGKPPATTPDDQALYTGQDMKDYFRVEITDPDGPTFLPSEARRVNTPPLPTDRSQHGRLRGFFFDYGSPGGSPFTRPGSPTPRPTGNHHENEDIDQSLPFRFNPIAEGHQFELNVPEHLPGSPLCPKSPLHSSGGKGVCVYHGRARTLPPQPEA